MTFTVEQIEIQASRDTVISPVTKCMLLDYAAMKRRETESVPVVSDPVPRYSWSADCKKVHLLNPEEILTTRTPSQPSTGVPVYGIDYGRPGEDKTCEVHGTRNPDGSIMVNSIIYKEAAPRSP